MNRYQFLDILKNKIESLCFKYMPVLFIFKEDSDPKHTSKLAKDWFYKEHISVLDWPAQSSNLVLNVAPSY